MDAVFHFSESCTLNIQISESHDQQRNVNLNDTNVAFEIPITTAPNTNGIYFQNPENEEAYNTAAPLPMMDWITTYDRNSGIQEPSQFDNAWREYQEILRMNENRLTYRNVPRLLILYTNQDRVRYMNCTLRMLFNSPVFIRFVFELGNITNLQLITNGIIQEKQNLFNRLFKIMEMALKENQDENIDIQLVRTFSEKYENLYFQENDWIEQDPEEFYIHLMDILKSIAQDFNQMEFYSKTLEIKSFISIDNDEPRIEKEHVIRIFSFNHNFSQYINQHYSCPQIKHDNKHTIKQEYELLPEQILVTDQRLDTTDHIIYPIEFQTNRNQRYLLNGAVILNMISSNSYHYIAMICRQDSVYLLDCDRIIDRFHIDYLSQFFASVHTQTILYTEVNQRFRYNCTFEDPLATITAEQPSYQFVIPRETDQLNISNQSRSLMLSIDELPVIIQHPILCTFQCHVHTDFRRNDVRDRAPILQNCLERNPLYFWPRSMFAGSFIECTLIFKAPNGHYYHSHYQFFREMNSNYKFENPTYFPIEQDSNEWFPLRLIISKSKENPCRDPIEQRTNTRYDNNPNNDIRQIVRFPDGNIEIIDEEKLLSFAEMTNTKKIKRTRSNNNSDRVSHLKLLKIIDVNTIYLALRRARYVIGQKKYVSDSNVVFCSNPFRPVNFSVVKQLYDYSSDKLQILSPLKRTLLDQNSPGIVHISYIIPETYKCTALRDKYIEVTIHTNNDGESHLHPFYRILNDHKNVNSMRIRVTEYSSTLNITIIRRSINELEDDFQWHQTSTDISSNRRTTSCSIVQNLELIINTPGMRRFCIQLELGHYSNNEFLIYPHSTVKSEIIVDNE